MVSAVDPHDPLITAQLYALQQQAYALEAQLIGCLEFPPLRESLKELSRSADTFLSFISEEQVLGALSFCISGSNVTITRLVVSPRHLRQGIATALIVELEQMVQPKATLFVSTAEANIPAIALYKRLGFRVSSISVSHEGILLIHLSRDTSEQAKPQARRGS